MTALEIEQFPNESIYTLFLNKNIVFPAQAEYSYVSADFRLKMFLMVVFLIIAYNISILGCMYHHWTFGYRQWRVFLLLASFAA